MTSMTRESNAVVLLEKKTKKKLISTSAKFLSSAMFKGPPNSAIKVN